MEPTRVGRSSTPSLPRARPSPHDQQVRSTSSRSTPFTTLTTTPGNPVVFTSSPTTNTDGLHTGTSHTSPTDKESHTSLSRGFSNLLVPTQIQPPHVVLDLTVVTSFQQLADQAGVDLPEEAGVLQHPFHLTRETLGTPLTCKTREDISFTTRAGKHAHHLRSMPLPPDLPAVNDSWQRAGFGEATCIPFPITNTVPHTVAPPLPTGQDDTEYRRMIQELGRPLHMWDLAPADVWIRYRRHRAIMSKAFRQQDDNIAAGRPTSRPPGLGDLSITCMDLHQWARGTLWDTRDVHNICPLDTMCKPQNLLCDAFWRTVDCPDKEAVQWARYGADMKSSVDGTCMGSDFK